MNKHEQNDARLGEVEQVVLFYFAVAKTIESTGSGKQRKEKIKPEWAWSLRLGKFITQMIRDSE